LRNTLRKREEDLAQGRFRVKKTGGGRRRKRKKRNSLPTKIRRWDIREYRFRKEEFSEREGLRTLL